MIERSSLSFCPVLKGSVWNITEELKQSGLIYLKNSLAKMELSTLIATWEKMVTFLFSFSHQALRVSLSLSAFNLQEVIFFFYYPWVYLHWCLI